MDFVDRDRRVQRVPLRARQHPVLVVPLVVANVEDDRRGAGSHFGEETVRVGLIEFSAQVGGQHFILVRRALAEARYEDLPDAGAGMQAHDLDASIPSVEWPDHAGPSCVRRPDREVNATHAAHLVHVGAEFIVTAIMRAFAEQVQVKVAQDGCEGIRIVKFALRAVGALFVQTVSEYLVSAGECGLKKAGVQLLHRRRHVLVQDTQCLRARPKCADDHCAAIVVSHDVRAQYGERISMPTCGDSVDDIAGERWTSQGRHCKVETFSITMPVRAGTWKSQICRFITVQLSALHTSRSTSPSRSASSTGIVTVRALSPTLNRAMNNSSSV